MNKITKKIAELLLVVATFACCGFTSAKATEQHQITYDLDGGNFTGDYPTSARWYQDVVLQKPEKKKYIFRGWSDGENILESVKHARNDVFLKATYTPEVYAVTFKNGDEVVSRTNYAYGSEVANLEKFAEGKDFGKAYEEFDCWVDSQGNRVSTLEAGISGNQELTAKLKGKTYSIEYDLDEGTAEGLPETYQYGTGVESFPDASKSGYNFTGWFSDKECTEKIESLSAEEHGNKHLYAGFEKIPVARPVSRSYSGGYSGTASQSSGPAASSIDASVGCYIPDINYYVSNAVLNGGQAAIDAEDTGMYKNKFNGAWFDSDENRIPQAEINNGRSVEGCHYERVPFIIYFDHASQNLTRLPERISAGSMLYLNGVAYTYSGNYVISDDVPDDISFDYRLMVATCTKEKGLNYYCFFY